MLGELLLRTHDLKKAKEIAGEMIEKWPDDRVAKLILAEGMMASGDSTKARELVNQVVKEDSKKCSCVFLTWRSSICRVSNGTIPKKIFV